jgi:transcriptional regulator with XRE-family HTH domain
MNPVSYARYLSTYSTTALAKKLSVSRQYISRLEQGLYDKPNKELLEWTTGVLNKSLDQDKQVTSAGVEQLYREWQWMQRETVKMAKILRPCSVTEFDRVKQPDIVYYYKIFHQWRSDYWDTTHGFCVDMCLHPSPVVDYEEGNTHSMPGGLRKVMNQLSLLGHGFKTHER